MCNNCKLHNDLRKLLDKYNLWTSHWSSVMDFNDDIWWCEDEETSEDEEDEKD